MKLRQRIVIFFIVFVFSVVAINVGFSFPAFDTVSYALSNVHIKLSDYRPNIGNVTYTITFNTANNKKLQAGDSITIHFIKKSGDNWVDNSQTVNDITNTPGVIKVNSYPCGHVFAANLNTGYLQFAVPDEITVPQSRITVVIEPQSGFTNPSPGTYAVYVNTSEETTPIISNEYKIGVPELSDVNVSVSPTLINAVADYEISFKTSNFGSLDAGSDRIRIKFPDSATLPSSIPKNTISVKANGVTKLVDSEIVPTSNNEVILTIPQGLSIGNQDLVHVSLPKSCGIKNPSDSGDYTLIVDTEEVDGTYIDSPTESNKFTITASSVSNVTVSVVPNEVNASPKITVRFRTSDVGGLKSDSGKIYIKFPEDESSFYVPQTLSKNYVLVNNVKPFNLTVDGYLVTITVSQDISSSSDVSVVFLQNSGIKNPSVSGKYKIEVWTSGDPSSVESGDIDIVASKITRPSVIVSPSITGMNASYVITFATGSSGALGINDRIYVTFPSGTYVPVSIPPSYVTINGAVCSSVSVSSRVVSISVSSIINSGSTVAIIFSKNAGIKNPSIPGQYTLKVHTDKEPNDVVSKPYLISKGVTTGLTVNPSVPDGENGYYKTVPTVEITVSNPSHLSYTVYYKWDDGNFEKYAGGKITVPEGIHTLYYYSVDQFQHKEQIHSKEFKVDSKPPVLSITSPKSGVVVNSPKLTIYGTTEPKVSLTVRVEGNIQTVPVDSAGKFGFDYTFNSNGTYTFVFSAKDEAGNITTAEVSVKFVSQKRIMLKVGALKAYVNDEKVILDAAPFIFKNRVMVPIRFISQSLGASVRWDPIFKIVTITMPDGREVRLQVGNSTAAVGRITANGIVEQAVKLDAPPVIKNNRTFVPIRFIAEAFGAEVDWDPEFMIVRITYPKPKP